MVKKGASEYALYKGEEILSIGTIKEIADKLGVLQSTINYYKTDAYINKISKRKKSKNARILIYLEDD